MTLPTQPKTIDEVFIALGERSVTFPKRLKQCAEFVAANPDRVAVSTVAELSEAAGVQPSAFMRFCQELGFSGFSQMQKLFRSDYSQKWPDYETRLAKLREHGSESPSALLAEFIDVGRASMENLMVSIDSAALQEAVDSLSKARMIHLVGFRRAFPVTSYLGYAFEKMQIPALLHSGLGNIDLAHTISDQDAVLAVTFAPYTQRTLQIAEEAKERGADLIAITDLVTSPLARLKPTFLLVAERDVGAFRALSASLSLAITLAVSVGTARKKI
ncbi:MAG: MurR/RpiR family transcriptional regulator [Rhodobacteraceae bacterium]|nr:MurR/RpiR family transcriptional regulator [Paracoccaceae bacterium]